jgi:hypothetical protein
VLRDPVKRRQYESMGHDSFHANTGFKPGSTDFKDLFKDFEDLFKEFGPMEDFFKQHFAAHKIQTEAHGGIFNFATDIRQCCGPGESLINGFLDPDPYILNYGSGSGGPAPDPRDLSRLEEVLEKSPIF